MNLFNQLSWISYFAIVILLLVVYYAFIGIRFYAADIQLLLRRSASPNNAHERLPDQLVFKGGENPQDGLPEEVDFMYASHSDDDIREADVLIASVKRCINAASSKSYEQDALVVQFKNIFKVHASLKTSPHRPAINELVVTECERTGVAELTEDEVDQWWSD